MQTINAPRPFLQDSAWAAENGLLPCRGQETLLKQDSVRAVDLFMVVMRARLVDDALIALEDGAHAAADMMGCAGQIEGGRRFTALLLGNIGNVEAQIIGVAASKAVAADGEILNGLSAFQ